jgi:hypothetical protein
MRFDVTQAVHLASQTKGTSEQASDVFSEGWFWYLPSPGEGQGKRGVAGGGSILRPLPNPLPKGEGVCRNDKL